MFGLGKLNPFKSDSINSPGNTLSTATGGLIGGQEGSDRLWGTSINQVANPWASDAAKIAALVATGYVAAPMMGAGATGGGLLGGSSALPAGGMTATGTMSAADAGLMGAGGYSALPAGGMTATGSMGASDAALMGAKTGESLAAPSAFQSFMGYAKPVGEAAMAANSVNSLLGGNRQPMPPSPMMQSQPNQNLNQIVSGNNQQSQFIQQQNEQERARRMGLLSRIGGR